MRNFPQCWHKPGWFWLVSSFFQIFRLSSIILIISLFIHVGNPRSPPHTRSCPRMSGWCQGSSASRKDDSRWQLMTQYDLRFTCGTDPEAQTGLEQAVEMTQESTDNSIWLTICMSDYAEMRLQLLDNKKWYKMSASCTITSMNQGFVLQICS